MKLKLLKDDDQMLCLGHTISTSIKDEYHWKKLLGTVVRTGLGLCYYFSASISASRKDVLIAI